MTPSGLLIVDKPAGMTSHSVVAAARRILGTRKVGHAGTLDPMATGVLILGVNAATRLLGYLALHDKEYAATIRLGATTLTDDAEGDILTRASAEDLAAITDDALHEAVVALTGDLMQVPTAISAIKVDGKRSYARVRAGEEVELKSRPVTVSRFDVHRVVRATDHIDLDVTVECTTGTYVRALARDLGAGLGVGGYLTALRRTRIGRFGIEDCVSLEQMEQDETPSDRLIGMGQAARVSFPVVVVDPERAHWVRNGRPYPDPIEATTAVLDGSGSLVAILEAGPQHPRYAAVFAEQ